MLLNKRVDTLLDQLSRSYDPSRAPEGVLLYSPSVLRMVAVCVYAVYFAGFLNNFFVSDFFSTAFSSEQKTQLFYSQIALVVVGAIGTIGVVIFARSHYKGAMLAGAMLGISSGMIASSYMFGLDVNPHLLLAVIPLLLVGFAVGRNGLILCAAWIVVTYAFLRVADTWGWWPRPPSISIDVVKHENLSAFIIMLAVLLATQLYLVKLGVALRKQGQLYTELQIKERHQAFLLTRIMTAQEEERKRIARDLHDAPLQDLFVLSSTLGNVRQEIQDMLASCEDTLLELSSKPVTPPIEDPTPMTVASREPIQNRLTIIALLNEWQVRLEKLLGQEGMFVAPSVTEAGTMSKSLSSPVEMSAQAIEPTLQSLIAQVKAVTEQMREICSALHPSYLDAPLVTAIEKSTLRLRTQKSGGNLELSVSGEEPPDLRDDIKAACKNIMEEAVRNAFAHAAASQVHVTLDFSSTGAIALTVADNGTGFEPRPIKELRSAQHYGLANMQERAELAGGEMQLTTVIGEGTIIRLTIPSQARTS